MEKVIWKNFFLFFSIFALFELLSLITFLFPALRPLTFFLIISLVFTLSLWRLEYGLLSVIGELFIGSKGYLFSLPVGQVTLSIRMALFLIILGVWIFNKVQSREFSCFKKRIVWAYLLFFVFLAFGVLHGLLGGNTPSNVFFDVNGYFYFALIFLFLDLLNLKNVQQNLWYIFTAGIVATFIKTFGSTLLFAFGNERVINTLYHWIRNTGIGEVTHVDGNLYRVFFQSHVYSMIGFAIFLAWFAFGGSGWRPRWAVSLLGLASFVILLGFSRSYWIGCLGAFMALFVLMFFTRLLPLRRAVIIFLTLFLIVFGEIFIIRQLIQPNLFKLVERRITVSEEEAFSTRLNQLQPLWNGIRKHPLLGSGFGAQLTYPSRDPRFLALHPDGLRTTSAFEWGYLDILLKIGALGFLSYLALVFSLLFQSWQLFRLTDTSLPRALCFGLFLGLISLLITHTFSPYLNHPLGIGYIMVMSALMDGLTRSNA